MKVAEWLDRLRKQDPTICCPQKTHFRSKDTRRLKVKEWKMIFQPNENKKREGIAILILDKIDLKPSRVIRDKNGYYIMIKGSIHQEDITIINMYAFNTQAP